MRMPATAGDMETRIESTSVPPLYWARIWKSGIVAFVAVKNTESAFTESIVPYCGTKKF